MKIINFIKMAFCIGFSIISLLSFADTKEADVTNHKKGETVMEQIPTQEGYIQFHGYKTWYKIVGKGEPGKYPLVCLHGGPGVPHDYLWTLEKIAATGRAHYEWQLFYHHR